jgi:hypothetical protein
MGVYFQPVTLADLIGISLGKNNHQKPAVIHTDIF